MSNRDEELAEPRSLSRTSTEDFQHESFSTFQHKIATLVQTLDNTEDIEVTRIGGGSFNRVIHVRFKREGHETEGIFRIPRLTSFKAESNASRTAKILSPRELKAMILNQVATLQDSEARETATPRVLGYDTTSSNLIRHAIRVSRVCGRQSHGNCLSESQR